MGILTVRDFCCWQLGCFPFSLCWDSFNDKPSVRVMWFSYTLLVFSKETCEENSQENNTALRGREMELLAGTIRLRCEQSKGVWIIQTIPRTPALGKASVRHDPSASDQLTDVSPEPRQAEKKQGRWRLFPHTSFFKMTSVTRWVTFSFCDLRTQTDHLRRFSGYL